ncbi:DUF4345 domain-containing protein [Myceligenerans pegani]|uniref:DUF4345 domain-containing protein n=1 Tax=Myceligenerans pegani TaxID=2776917 RepID=A0ABR9N346_9MICO|nr:DUF4345 domain-containing protein [Myceligenerans sp. TRM 65318]MBE1878071.1 DUF4345 domain-containing protein [Myceligenerans sp. TRM 65318]MBE3020342.1 DUF4345 domain-containing protein [Myceligenerans sp. TRM 65318]
MTRHMSRWLLAATGLTLAVVGSGVAFVPQPFYAGYGITLADGAPLLGELRASGLTLLTWGALVGAGAVMSRLAATSALVGSVTMLAHAAGRVLSWASDGGLAPGLAAAGAVELALGVACVWVLTRPQADGGSERPRPATVHDAGR